MRYFVDLGYQPVIMEIAVTPPFPVWPAQSAYESSYVAFIPGSTMQQAISSIGLDPAVMNFNTTPSRFMLTLTDHYNSTIAGFIFNATEAPPPKPVIKGAAGHASSTMVVAVMAALAALLFV